MGPTNGVVHRTCVPVVVALNLVGALCDCSRLLLSCSCTVVEAASTLHRLHIEEVHLRCCPLGGLSCAAVSDRWSHGEIGGGVGDDGGCSAIAAPCKLRWRDDWSEELSGLNVHPDRWSHNLLKEVPSNGVVTLCEGGDWQGGDAKLHAICIACAACVPTQGARDGLPRMAPYRSALPAEVRREHLAELLISILQAVSGVSGDPCC